MAESIIIEKIQNGFVVTDLDGLKSFTPDSKGVAALFEAAFNLREKMIAGNLACPPTPANDKA